MTGQQSHESRERAVAFVVARLSSSRLPQKQLQPIGEHSIIDWIMRSLSHCGELDRIVLATVAGPENEPLRVLALQRGWTLFWYDGEVNDVVGRLARAAVAFEADICLLISADCPLVHGPSVDQLVRQLRDQPSADYLVTPSLDAGKVCLLEGVQLARRKAWLAAERLSNRPELREHQFPMLYRRPDLFERANATLDVGVYGQPHRMSVDTLADLEFMREARRRLEMTGNAFDLPGVVALMEEQPSIRQLNAHVHQRALVETIVPVLFIADAGGEFGFGHLMRCCELALQTVERLGWPVTFVIDDAAASKRLRTQGFRCRWGAFGRPVRRAAPSGITALTDDDAASFGLTVVDVSVRRELPAGSLPVKRPRGRYVFVDREDGVAARADLVVYPGVSGRRPSTTSAAPVACHGLDYTIIRREVRRLQETPAEKDIDLLAYLYDDRQRRLVRELADCRGWRLVMPDDFDGFVDQLARSRVFLSGFGQAFYEAAALSTVPVAWPLSPNHAADAGAFYNALGSAPLIVQSAVDLEAVLAPLVESQGSSLPILHDGTPAIVARLAQLMSNEQG